MAHLSIIHKIPFFIIMVRLCFVILLIYVVLLSTYGFQKLSNNTCSTLNIITPAIFLNLDRSHISQRRTGKERWDSEENTVVIGGIVGGW